jgi:hypothetical protein
MSSRARTTRCRDVATAVQVRGNVRNHRAIHHNRHKCKRVHNTTRAASPARRHPRAHTAPATAAARRRRRYARPAHITSTRPLTPRAPPPSNLGCLQYQPRPRRRRRTRAHDHVRSPTPDTVDPARRRRRAAAAVGTCASSTAADAAPQPIAPSHGPQPLCRANRLHTPIARLAHTRVATRQTRALPAPPRARCRVHMQRRRTSLRQAHAQSRPRTPTPPPPPTSRSRSLARKPHSRAVRT